MGPVPRPATKRLRPRMATSRPIFHSAAMASKVDVWTAMAPTERLSQELVRNWFQDLPSRLLLAIKQPILTTILELHVTQKEHELTVPIETHFLAWDQFLGFSGSSGPSQSTKSVSLGGSFSVSPPVAVVGDEGDSASEEGCLGVAACEG